MRALLIALALTVAGCGAGTVDLAKAWGGKTVDTATLKRSAFTAYGVYVTAVEGAAAYASLPRCTATRPPPCSKQAVVDEMRRLDREAYPYVDRAATLARQAEPTVTVLEVAVRAAETAATGFQAYVAANKGG